MSEVWYRYTDHLQSLGYDWDAEYSYGSRVVIRCEEYYVVKHTPKGVWLSSWEPAAGWVFDNAKVHEWARFVLKGARKRFACPTKEEAKASFVARKKAQLRIYQARVLRAQDALKALDDPGLSY